MSTTNVNSFPPVQVPLTDQGGLLNPVWAKWFQQTYIQTGGSSSASLSSLITTVAALTVVVNLNTANITALTNVVNGIGCGRQL